MKNEKNQKLMDRLQHDPVANVIVPNRMIDFNILYPNVNFNRTVSTVKKEDKQERIKPKKQEDHTIKVQTSLVDKDQDEK